MPRSVSYAALVALCLVCTVHLSGCSLIGFGIGSAIDAKNTHMIVPPGNAVTVAPGAVLAVELDDGTTARGKYDGVERQKASEYAPRFTSWREGVVSGFWVPAIGDSVVLETRAGQKLPARFLGFSYRAIDVETAGDPTPHPLPFETLSRVTAATGEFAQADTLAARDAEGKLPVCTLLRLRRSREVRTVPLDAVRTVQLEGHGAARKGLLIGLGLDAAAVVLVVAIAAAVAGTEAALIDGCSSSGWTTAQDVPEVRPLDRPYDRLRGRPLEPAYAAR